MNKSEALAIDFSNSMNDAVKQLKSFHYDKAYELIMKAMNADPNAAEPHNLLGIWYEFNANKDLARKHYRIAYVLNPVYKPASENLERVSTLFLTKEIPVNYGEEPAGEEDKPVKDGNLS